jgi:hypothetical protein
MADPDRAKSDEMALLCRNGFACRAAGNMVERHHKQ